MSYIAVVGKWDGKQAVIATRRIIGWRKVSEYRAAPLVLFGANIHIPSVDLYFSNENNKFVESTDIIEFTDKPEGFKWLCQILEPGHDLNKHDVETAKAFVEEREKRG